MNDDLAIIDILIGKLDGLNYTLKMQYLQTRTEIERLMADLSRAKERLVADLKDRLLETERHQKEEQSK